MPTRPSGIAGLDEITGGGFPANRLHLVEGAPGSGKTTLALQFLLDGARRGESVLYITLAETAEELRVIAQSHGWDLTGVTIREFAPSEESLRPEEQYTILHPTEVELTETTWAVLEEVERTKPARVVFDSLAELRLLAGDRLRYRRQVLGLKQFFAGRRSTVLLLESADASDSSLASVAYSVLHLQQYVPDYGRERRRLRYRVPCGSGGGGTGTASWFRHVGEFARCLADRRGGLHRQAQKRPPPTLRQ